MYSGFLVIYNRVGMTRHRSLPFIADQKAPETP